MRALLSLIGLYVFGISILFSNFKNEIEDPVDISEFSTYLDNRIPALMDDYNIPGVNIALVKNGKTVWTKAYGYANLEEGTKMTTDTYCRVESISKSVTAWGIMKLVEQGKIDLDAPVTDYIKNWTFPKSKFPVEDITIRQLLSHTSGMPLGTIGVRYSPNEDMPTLKESLTNDAILQNNPGESFSYSNTGFNILELLIEEVTGRDFSTHIEQEVLMPLGMKNSSFTWQPNLNPPVPNGYDLKGNSIPVYVYPNKASGGLFSTVEDISTFIYASMTNFSTIGFNVLDAKHIEKLYQPVVEIPGYYGLVFDSYGLGHFIEALPNGEKAVSHGGQGSGWMTHFHSVPETGDGIVILTNSQRSWPFFGHILKDWAKWNEFESIGMAKILLGTKILWAFICLIFLIVIWQLWRLRKGIVSRNRIFLPLTFKSGSLRIVQIVLFLALVFGLLWSIDQDYLFVFSVFPMASIWLMISMWLIAFTLLFYAVFPLKKIKTENHAKQKI